MTDKAKGKGTLPWYRVAAVVVGDVDSHISPSPESSPWSHTMSCYHIQMGNK